MTIDLSYWAGLGEHLGWRSQFRDPIPNDVDRQPRSRGAVQYGIIHHTATANEPLAADLMRPGGRTVSCNRLTGTDGKFRVNIPEQQYRAYTSASWLDDIADTTEVVNSTGPDTYGMSDLSIMALAIWMVEKYRAGRLRAITRQYIIGHYEVLGISGAGYATSCPGPNTIEADRRLDLITELAQAIYNGKIGPGVGAATPERNRMYSIVPDAQSTTQFVQSLVSGDKRAIGSPYHKLLLQRVQNNDGTDKMLTAEMEIVNGYLSVINPFAEAKDIDRVVDALEAITITPEAMRDALKAALAEGTITVDTNLGEGDLDAIAERVAKLLGIRIAGGDLAGA